MPCPADEQLVAFINGLIPEHFCQKIEEHLLECFECQRRLPELDLESQSVLTSLYISPDLQVTYANEPQCQALQDYGKSLTGRVFQVNQKSTIVVDSSRVNRGLPEFVGRYKVIRHLGSGSFGTVLLARDEQLDRHVAIKIAHPNRIRSPQDAERYQREAKLLAKMEHPNIVPVFDSGLTDTGLVYIVFRFIRGSDLAEMMRPERFPRERTIQLTISTAKALHHMHVHGIVHRDIKPANILIDDAGIPYVTDFGLAIRSEETSSESDIVGTLAYMSPEQLSGDGHLVGPRSDVFSLGVVLFELLTGERPFKNRQANNPIGWITDVPSPRDADDSIPPVLDRICQKALQNRSADRYATALEFASDLQRFLDQKGEEASDVSAQPVYRGLRAFRGDDHEFFTQLIPGLRSSEGNPEPVQFWLNRLGNPFAESAPRIGVIYGTSGSGKSSLVNAAIIPRIADDAVKVSIQASPTRTEIDLSNALKKVFRESGDVESLPELCRRIRKRKPPFANARVLIVIDQFEQWLHGCKIDLSQELVQTLRQCDGQSIQCLLIVRDDFWVELSQFMRTVEEPMREGENIMAVEPFAVEHARLVLDKIGLAVKGEPEDPNARKGFIERGVKLIESDGTVSPVRLALFVEITRELPWKSETIRHFNDLKELAYTYIKQRFDPELCPRRYRTHTAAIKKIMYALMPERGNDLKGQGRSLPELQELCGYEKSPERFKQLLELLDRDLRIISPVLQGGDEGSERLNYQLTHDYLVPAIRAWLDEEETRTYRGRAKLKLKDRTALWGMKRESRQLPGFWEVCHIVTGTRSSQWTAEETRLMKSAFRIIFRDVSAVAVVACFLVAMLMFWLRSDRDKELLSQLTQSSILKVPDVLQQIDHRMPRMAPAVETAYAAAAPESFEKSRLDLAMLRVDPAHAENLQSQVLQADSTAFPVLIAELKKSQADLSAYRTLLNDGQLSQAVRFRAACASLAAFEKEAVDDEIIEEVAAGLVRQSPQTIPDWTLWLADHSDALVPRLESVFHSDAPFGTPNNAAIALTVLTVNDPGKYAELLSSANDVQLHILSDAVFQKSDAVIDSLLAMLEFELERPPAESGETVAKILTALAHLGKADLLGPHLKRQSDPTIRCMLIENLASSQADTQLLIEILENADSSDVIAATLKVLGTSNSNFIREQHQETIRSIASDLYQTHPDAEVHGSAEWLLRMFGEELSIPSSSEPDLNQAQWFVTPSGYTMVIPEDFNLPIELNESLTDEEKARENYEIDWRFAVATTEVTCGKYMLFNPDYKQILQEVEDANCPVNRVDLVGAMSYCNWLTLQDGMTEQDQCYVEVKGRMVPHADFLVRRGYRLPLEKEWEIAVRGGTETPFIFGSDSKLSFQYGWIAQNSKSMLHPVGMLKPNQIGLFDVCGNVSEWCHDGQFLETIGQKYRGFPAPMRGGSFHSFNSAMAPYGSMRSGERLKLSRQAAFPNLGFRIARRIDQ